MGKVIFGKKVLSLWSLNFIHNVNGWFLFLIAHSYSTGISHIYDILFVLKDEFAATVEAWNELRAEAVTIALTKIVMPELRRELQAVLLQESKEYVLK